MRTIAKGAIFALFISLFVGVTGTALAYNPSMSVYISGNSTTVSITGGQPNASVVISYTPYGSSLSTSVTGVTDYSGSFTTMVDSANSSQITATVGGQQVYANGNGYNYNNGCGYYGCSVGGFSLSQTSLSLSVGQSASVTASLPYPVSGYSSNIYIGSNSNSGVASASVSGNQVTVYGANSGSTSISICANASSGSCATLYVTVSGGSSCGYYDCSVGGLTLSQNNLTLTAGQSSSVTVSVGGYVYSSGYYISSNSNSSVASASISGGTVYVNGISSGSTNIYICQNSGSSQCVTLYVTVNGGYSSGGVIFSPSTVNLSLGQSSTVYITAAYYGTSLYISNNSNAGVVSASLSGSTMYLLAGSVGSSTITVCQSNSVCGSLYVSVGGSGYSGNIYLSPSSLSLTAGQNSTVVINNASYAYGNYYISSNSNSTVASASISGSSLYVNALSPGSTNLIVCQSSSGSSCATLYVTVSGVLGANTNLWFSPGNPTIYIGQSLAVSINSSAYSSVYPYSSSAYYISSNSNSNVVSAGISGTALNLTGYQNGTSSIMVCNSGLGFCGTLYVTVGGGLYNGSNIILSQYSLGMNVGQTSTVNVSGAGGYGYYISSNSNPGAVSASFNGSVITVYAISSGSSTLQICQNSASSCSSLLVTVGGGYSYGGVGLIYPRGNVLGASTFPNGQLISEGSTVYIVYKNTKTAFVSGSVFLGLGFKFSNVMAVGNSSLADSGYTVTNRYTQHPWGSWVKSGNTIYFVHDSGLIPLPDWATFLINGGQANLIVPANIYDFRLPILSPMATGDPRLQ